MGVFSLFFFHFEKTNSQRKGGPTAEPVEGGKPYQSHLHQGSKLLQAGVEDLMSVMIIFPFEYPSEVMGV